MNERLYKQSDVAMIFNVSRQTAYNWKGSPFTAVEIEGMIQLQHEQLARVKKTWAALNDRMDAEDELKNVQTEKTESEPA